MSPLPCPTPSTDQLGASSQTPAPSAAFASQAPAAQVGCGPDVPADSLAVISTLRTQAIAMRPAFLHSRGLRTPGLPQTYEAAAALRPQPTPKDCLCAADMRAALRGRVVILLGYPGAGKGTQGKLLESYLGSVGISYPHLSTGELFRSEVAAQTPVGKRMQAAMLAGVPISDDVVFPYLRDKLAKPPYNNGFILDGFPKNASSFDFIMQFFTSQNIAPLCALHIDIARTEVEARLTQRLHCRPCDKDYQPSDFAGHIGSPHRCHDCHGPLAMRDDDQPAAIRRRLDTFDTHTAPLLKLFMRDRLLYTLAATGDDRDAGSPAALQKAELHEALLRTISAVAVAALPQTSYPFASTGSVNTSVFHSHVDARNAWVLTDILQDVHDAVATAQNKVYPVARLACGPQMVQDEFADVYRHLPNFHPIDTCPMQAIEAFATGNMGEAGFNYAQVRATLQSAYARPGQSVMTELEEEIYESATDASGITRTTLDRGLTPAVVEWAALGPWRHNMLPTIPTFEMHHAVDLPKKILEHAPPFALEALMAATTAAGFNVGGWFLFAKSDRWALRSNEFTSAPYAQTRTRLDAQSVALRQCVRGLMPPDDRRPVTSRAFLEKVHAVWQVG